MYENNRQKDFFWGAFVGGTLATLSALLFTTKKGKQIQRKLADTYEEVEESAKDLFNDAKEKAEEAGKAGKSAAHKAKEHLEKDVKHGVNASKEKVEDMADHVEKKVAHKTKDEDHHHHATSK